jgi:molybdenum cofactor cytidylyltransferase
VTRVGAVVLAAGGSSRMGRPKQLLPFHGRTLLRHTAEVAVAAVGGPVVVVLGNRASELALQLDGLPVFVVENAAWSQGPGTSVRAGMRVIDEHYDVDAVVFLLCDQPFVDVVQIGLLLEVWRESGLPMGASGYSETVGVPAVFACECFPALHAIEASAGAKQLLVQRPDAVTVVPFPAGAVDLDTPEDYERLRTTSPVFHPEEPHVPRQ